MAKKRKYSSDALLDSINTSKKQWAQAEQQQEAPPKQNPLLKSIVEHKPIQSTLDPISKALVKQAPQPDSTAKKVFKKITLPIKDIALETASSISGNDYQPTTSIGKAYEKYTWGAPNKYISRPALDIMGRPANAATTFIHEEATGQHGDLERFKSAAKKALTSAKTSIWDSEGQYKNTKTFGDIIESNPIMKPVIGREHDKAWHTPKNLANSTVQVLATAGVDPFSYGLPKGANAVRTKPTLDDLAIAINKSGLNKINQPIKFGQGVKRETLAKYDAFKDSVKPKQLALPAPRQLALPEPAIQQPPISIKGRTLSGKTTLKTPYEKSINRYNEAIEDVQNYYKTDQLRDSEKLLVKQELGIDLDKMVDDIARAEGKTTKQVLDEVAEYSKMKRAAGATENNSYNILNRMVNDAKLRQPIQPILPKKNPFEVPTQFRREMPNRVLPGEMPARLNPASEVVATTAPKIKENLAPMLDQPIQATFKDRAKNWQDKSMLSLKRETPERNFEDIMGKDAPEMIEKYIAPVHNNESDSVRFINKQFDDVRSLKLNKKDSVALQKYGEGVINLEQLKQEAPKSWQKIDGAVNVFRQKYNEVLPLINEVLERNGYPTIPYRKDYFPHMKEIDGLMDQLGLSLDNLPTDINGLTDDFKPNKPWFGHALKRTGERTEYDALKGYEKYMHGAAKIIYHTDDIKRLRTFEKTIRDEFAGTDHLSNFVTELTDYTNSIAGKKSKLDRGAEHIVGRQIYAAVDKIRNRVSANIIGANLSASLTNFIPLTQSLATTSKTSFAKALYETVANGLKNDGFINKSNFLTRRLGTDKLSQSVLDKVVDKSMLPFKIADKFVSQVIVRSKYLEGLSKGLADKEALKAADEWAARIMADRSLGSTPTLFNSKTLAPLTQFQIEVNNQLSFMFKDMPRHLSKGKLVSSTIQLAIYSYLFNELYEKTIGRRPAFDPIGITLQVKKDISEGDPKKAVTNLGKNIKDSMPFSSIVSGGRLPISNVIPSFSKIATGEKKLLPEVARSLAYLVVPTGLGQMTKSSKGLTAMDMNPFSKQEVSGIYDTNSKGEKYLKYPVANTIENKIKGAIFGTSSFKETSDFYENNRSSLSPGQTKEFEKEIKKGRQIEAVYQDLLKVRELNKKIENRQEEIKAQFPTLKDHTSKYKRDPNINLLKQELNNIKRNTNAINLKKLPVGGNITTDAKKNIASTEKNKPYYGNGNIDLNDRPVIKNPDGSISTVFSMSFTDDNGNVVLVPGVRKGLNRQMTPREAWGWYLKTGEYLGKFKTQAEADRYAESLHEEQATSYK